MDKPTPSIRDLAQRLLAAEAASQDATGAHVHEAVRVCEKLRIALTRFAGADGFTSLMRRALALARTEFPALNGVTKKADGSLGGLEELAADAGNSGVGGGAEVVAIVTHLLGLLVAFIGEPLTLRLVREAWPAASLDK